MSKIGGQQTPILYWADMNQAHVHAPRVNLGAVQRVVGGDEFRGRVLQGPAVRLHQLLPVKRVT